MNRILKILFFKSFPILAVLMQISCSSVRYVPDDRYLLCKNRIIVNDKSFEKAELGNYIVQVPNKKVLGIKLNLFFYNLSNLNKIKWPNEWLRRIGEGPVIIDKFSTIKTNDRLKKYMEQTGYFNAFVTDSIYYFKEKRAKIEYHITPNEPALINNISYLIKDTSIAPFIIKDTAKSLLHKKMIFNKNILNEERIRLEQLMLENGYYRFKKEYIHYDALITDIKNEYDLKINIEEFQEGEMDPKSKIHHHPKYMIGNVVFITDFSSGNLISQPENQLLNPDTIELDGFKFVYKNQLKIRTQVLINHNYIIPGETYRKSNEINTYRNLSNLGLYKFVNLNLQEPDTIIQDSSGRKTLNCRIDLTRKNIQFLQHDIVGTYSSNFGARYNVLYQNYNFFRGAEIFNAKLTGAFEVQDTAVSELSRTWEAGAEVKLSFPKFLLPFISKEFVKKFDPKTSLSFAWNHRDEQQYARTIATISFGYNWRGNRYLSHYVSPLDVNFISINRISDAFAYQIRNSILKYSLQNHLIAASRYRIEFSNQEVGKLKDFKFMRVNIESAGNFFSSFYSIAGIDKQNISTIDSVADYKYIMFKVPFSQYLRTDIDLKYYWYINPKNNLVFHTYAGMGYPFGNSGALPFEKKFFVGGPNSIRAWNAYTLGPGSKARPEKRIRDYNNSADIKIEANLEYRFKMVWKFHGALFVDAANIWNIFEDKTIVGSTDDKLFKWDNFFKEIAFGTGFGIRLDLSFFLLRLDMGVKLKDPGVPEGERWIPFNRKFERQDFTFQFGIGYPF